MKVTKLIFLFFFISTLTYAQVGINNTDPKASLDITATNQATPSNTDGLLIPRIDDFPATAPTAAQQGMLVYLTTISGGNAPGYYYWDNTTSSWKAMLGTSDADFFEAGGTPPNNIADDIYTLGRVKIGSSTFMASDGALNVDSNESKSATFTNTNTSAVGARIILNADNSDIKTGINITLIGTTSGAPYINSGLKFTDLMVGDQNRRGIYQTFLGTNTSTSPLIAIYNHFDSSSEYSGRIRGLFNSIESIGDGRHTGVENILKSDGDGFHYGTTNTLEGTGIGFKYGSYNYISVAAGGTHYGVYSDVQSPTGFAGYFLGRVAISTASGIEYIFPSSRGSNGQVMQTDVTGNLSWVTPTQNDADWFEEGSTSPPNNINSNIFTQGNVGIGTNAPVSGLDLNYTSDNSNSANNRDAMTVNYTSIRSSSSGISSGIKVIAKINAPGIISAGYFQITDSNGADKTMALKGSNSANSTENVGIELNVVGSGLVNYGVRSVAFGSTTNWAGYFGSLTNGSGNVFIGDLLQVNGALKFTNGAIDNYILKTDALGNATWVNPTVLQDADWHETGGTAPNSIGDDIYTNGKVGINISTPDTRLHLKHTNSGTSGGFKLENRTANSWRLYVSSGASGDFRFYSSVNSNALTAVIDGNSGAYFALSDRRLKKDFNNLYFQWEEFMKLKPLTYRFKAQKNEKKHIGLVAQDVEKIYPELVSYTKDEDVYQLDYSATGIIAIKAVQELKKEVDTLKEENQELKKQLKKYEDLDSRLSALENNNNQIYIAEKANK